LNSHPTLATPAPADDRNDRLAFLRIDAATRDRLKALRPGVQGALPDVAKQFYAHLRAWPALAAKLGDDANIDRLRRAQADHWNGLFTGTFDDAYFERASRIGQVHERIGLEPRWYSGAYAFTLEKLVGAVVARHGGKKALSDDIGALLRAAFLNMEIATSTFMKSGDGFISEQLLGVSDVLERELQLASGEISGQAGRLSDGAEQLAATAQQLLETSTAVSKSVETTSENVHTVADATGELESSSRDIAAQIAQASAATGKAVEQADASGEAVQGLSNAARKIDDAVGLVQNIARQTRMLALNATIEAARAGEAGRGFAVVATEVKDLARQTEEAIQTVSAESAAIARSTGSAVNLIGGISGQIRTVDGVTGEVATVAAQQQRVTAAIASHIGEASQHTQAVADKARMLLVEAEAAEETAQQFRSLASNLTESIQELNRRMTVILRSSYAGNRRVDVREPISLRYRATMAGRNLEGFTGDLSAGGALLIGEGDASIVNAIVPVEIDGVGRVLARVAAATKTGIHLQFRDVAPAQAGAIARLIADAQAMNKVYLAQAKDIAAKVIARFEQGLAKGEIAEATLFDSMYRKIPGSAPEQHSVKSNAFTDIALPAIMDPPKDGDPRVVFCLATDRNGYIGTHNRDYSHPQRPNDVVWNTANCRNRRIFTDRTAILAARNREAAIVQAYQRDMGGGRMVMLKEFDAPITITGRHWGAVRLAISL
jgi:methyl-accepting chemotaxis protein